MKLNQIDSPADILKLYGWSAVRMNDTLMYHHRYYERRVTIEVDRIVKRKKVHDRQWASDPTPRKSPYDVANLKPGEWWVGQHDEISQSRNRKRNQSS
jgi:hypothetical protein